MRKIRVIGLVKYDLPQKGMQAMEQRQLSPLTLKGLGLQPSTVKQRGILAKIRMAVSLLCGKNDYDMLPLRCSPAGVLETQGPSLRGAVAHTGTFATGAIHNYTFMVDWGFYTVEGGVGVLWTGPENIIDYGHRGPIAIGLLDNIAGTGLSISSYVVPCPHEIVFMNSFSAAPGTVHYTGLVFPKPQ